MELFEIDNQSIVVSKQLLIMVATVATVLISGRKTYQFAKNPRQAPHAITWLLLAILGGFATVAMVASGAGWAALVLLVTTGFNTANSYIGFKKGGARNFTRLTWTSVALVVVAGVMWQITSNPLTATVCLTVASVVAFVPTIQKAYRRPFSENKGTYMANMFRYACATLAVADFSWASALYPGTWVFMNGGIWLFLVTREAWLNRVGYDDETTRYLILLKIAEYIKKFDAGQADLEGQIALTQHEASYLSNNPRVLEYTGRVNGDWGWTIRFVASIRAPSLKMTNDYAIATTSIF